MVTVTLTLDETEIEAAEGATILEAADAAGIYIPRLCSHPDLPEVDPDTVAPWREVWQGSTKHGNGHGGGYEGCRLCVVEVASRAVGTRVAGASGAAGASRAELVRACATPVEAGMRIVTTGREIDALRGSRLREIFATHPHACIQCAQKAGCSREPCSTNVAKEERCCPIFHDCELRRVAEFVGIPDDTPRYRPSELPRVEDEPLILRDFDLCIGCLRCVRVCRDVREIDALGFVLGENGQPLVGAKAATLLDSGCVFCLSCAEICPTGALRIKMDELRREGNLVTRCVAACPAGIDIPRYLRETRRGEFARAEAVVREAAPLPRVLGQVCFHPCEESCLRHELGLESVAICALKRAAVDHADQPLWKAAATPPPSTGKKVAIVGAGPAGLSASWFLALKGHEAIVFDAQPAAGGWLRNGIPAFRLDRNALEADVSDIAGLGVEFRLGIEVGKDIPFEDIRSAHDAVFVAVGARRAKPLPCDGVDLPGVDDGLKVLSRLATEGTEAPTFAGETVVVIGGGNVAIDVARTAIRLGPAAVLLFCLEERDQMPAYSWEIEEAEREGVVMRPGWGPKRIQGDTNVQSVDFRRCTAVFDDEGTFAPEYDEGTVLSQKASRVLVAIGQVPALEFLERPDASDIHRTRAGTLGPDAVSLQVTRDGVFAGGEVVSGPASVVAAIEQGRRAASGIDRFLGGDGEVSLALIDATEPDAAWPTADSWASGRIPMPRLADGEATSSFRPVELGYTRDDAVREAYRCSRCDLRLHLRENPRPPEPWLELTPEVVVRVPESEGVYRLLDEEKVVYAIKGVADLRAALAELVETSTKARYFLVDQDPMFSKRESELIQEYLQAHGCMPPGEGDDDLDDLF